jgi:hypothetical protein
MSPTLILVAIALGTAFGATLNWMVLRRKSAGEFGEVRQQVAALQKEVSGLSTQLRQQETQSLSPVLPVKGFNLNRRPEAVRRMRAGHQPNQLVSATGWSVAELDLLQKVEKLHQ